MRETLKTAAVFSVSWKARLCLIALAAFATGCRPSGAETSGVREPAVAGQFYPASADELGAMVDKFLNDANPPKVEGRIRAIMVPHAGYVYSGSTAAYAYKALAGQTYKTVILVGNSHHQGYEGVAVSTADKFRTPLGDVDVDTALAKKLTTLSDMIVFRESPHVPEHSLEVQLPFLQKTLVGKFKIVPILMGTASGEISAELGDALSKVVDADTLVIASSDMSHYPKYADANYEDHKVIDAILTGKADNLERTIHQLERMSIPNTATCLCGEGAVKAVMICAEKIGATNVQFLKYANSGDTAGTKDRVVGYSAIVFTGGSSTNAGSAGTSPVVASPAAGGKDDMLTKEEQQALLKLAKTTVETYVRTREKPAYTNTLSNLDKELGAFVTLKEGGELRGCIGRFQPDIPLYEVVMEMAVAAATEDHRFPPVSKSELGKLEYEISVLSPLKKVGSWKEIELGKHGVEVARGMNRGVFLPQVATETGWDLEKFMSILCTQKAGLPADAWKDPKTDLYVFTAQVFGDKE